MDFKTATDLIGVSHEQLAEELGCSVQTIRQARLTPDKNSHRPPPKGWEDVVAWHALEKIEELRRLVAEVKPERTEEK